MKFHVVQIQKELDKRTGPTILIIFKHQVTPELRIYSVTDSASQFSKIRINKEAPVLFEEGLVQPKLV